MSVVSKDNAEHYIWGERCDGWHLVKSPTLSVIQERVPSGCAEVRHLHQKAEQFFFVLSGVATLEVGGETYTLHPHQGKHVPAGVPHQLRNESPEDIIFTVTSTPPSHGDRVNIAGIV
ncbi:cupin domain-containing protein [Hahella sp. KA22]|uniref:cupin domain-containing protein n=1 Tax=Hahella sp. KA22 TaxID=1628392 RepID=UPI000FDDCE7E|nr:cupin domain-containing protein [Hahella sp. KA22]AZZ90251.1 cupin domain-containing protein [Hahella sp. KA22]QAY53621.1 cupin domain-containing protein [Hahella sp. KA22]